MGYSFADNWEMCKTADNTAENIPGSFIAVALPSVLKMHCHLYSQLIYVGWDRNISKWREKRALMFCETIFSRDYFPFRQSVK
jgi:hypothetical protein